MNKLIGTHTTKSTRVKGSTAPRPIETAGLKSSLTDHEYGVLQDFIALTLSVGSMSQDRHVARQVEALTGKSLHSDPYGNFWLAIGDATEEGWDTCFCAHLDTVAPDDTHPRHQAWWVGSDLWVGSNLTTILGADDRAGCTVLVHLIREEIPGLYYFFTGEEVGRKGSQDLLNGDSGWSFPAQKLIQFDRFGEKSIVTHQCSSRCASESFTRALSASFKALGLDLTGDAHGLYTDSYTFRGQVPECVNLSVGYVGHHTKSEAQNISFLSRLILACQSIDWDALPVDRDPTCVEPTRTYSYSDSWRYPAWDYYKDSRRKTRSYKDSRPSQMVVTPHVLDMIEYAGIYETGEIARLLRKAGLLHKVVALGEKASQAYDTSTEPVHGFSALEKGSYEIIR